MPIDDGGYKSDLRAAHARLRALEQENRELQARLEEPSAKTGPGKKGVAPFVALAIVVGGLAAIVAALRLGGARAGAITALVLLSIPIEWMVWRKLIQVVSPNELLVVSGRRYRVGNKVLGYRLVRAGRVLLIPFIERAERIDLTAHVLSVKVQHALTRTNERVTVELSATVKISSADHLAVNAVERFLGRDRSEIDRAATETIEGKLRAFCATLELKEMHLDRLIFAEKLCQELEDDMNRLGLELDTLAIHAVS